MDQLYLPRFVNRQWELAQLEDAWSAPGAQFITIWGRRRVGKSALLARFAAGKRAVYLYGTRIAEREMLENLSLQAAGIAGMEYLQHVTFPNWDAALNTLSRHASEERLLIIFDEFPFMCQATQGLDTLVQRWWDLSAQHANLMFVIAGSAFTAMAGLTGYRGALFGRRTGQMDLAPFDYFDSAAFYPHLSPADRVRTYACFGGLPAYLRYWQPEWAVREAVMRTMLNPDHPVFHDAEALLRTEFHQEALYAAILRAIASGEERPSDIARMTGRQGVNEIAEHLRRLQDLRYVRRHVPVTERERLRSHRVLYRLDDPYLRFWFRYVSRYQSSLQLGAASEVWSQRVEPTLDEFVARTTWEDVCIQYLWRRVAARLPLPWFHALGRWWDGQTEIDIIGLYDGQVVLAGECKWTTSPMRLQVLQDLETKARQLPLAERPLWVLASRSGFEPALRRRAEHGDVLLIEPDDLYAPELARR
jgi:AAA+ ATPase superfamily predicted ATPase